MGSHHSKDRKTCTQIVVNGYIREQIKDYEILVPQDICDLCSKYCYIPMDSWNPDLIFKSHVKFEENTLTIFKSYRANGTTTFLSEVIETGTFEWKFRINVLFGTSSAVGIWRINDKIKEKDKLGHNCLTKYYQSASKGYAIARTCSELGILKKGDIITMILDMNGKTLTYFVNDENKGSESVKKSGKYRAAFNLYYGGDSVTLLEN